MTDYMALRQIFGVYIFIAVYASIVYYCFSENIFSTLSIFAGVTLGGLLVMMIIEGIKKACRT